MLFATGTAEVLPYCWLKQRLDCTGVHFAPLEGVVSGPKVCSAGSILPPDERPRCV